MEEWPQGSLTKVWSKRVFVSTECAPSARHEAISFDIDHQSTLLKWEEETGASTAHGP